MEPEPVQTETIDVVFDGPPGPQPGRFIEVEKTSDGTSINAGSWHERPDGKWALRLVCVPEHRPDAPWAALHQLAATVAGEYGTALASLDLAAQGLRAGAAIIAKQGALGEAVEALVRECESIPVEKNEVCLRAYDVTDAWKKLYKLVPILPINSPCPNASPARAERQHGQHNVYMDSKRTYCKACNATLKVET